LTVERWAPFDELPFLFILGRFLILLSIFIAQSIAFGEPRWRAESTLRGRAIFY
jgi:hypothetical protein